jgi:hypothetical protein
MKQGMKRLYWGLEYDWLSCLIGTRISNHSTRAIKGISTVHNAFIMPDLQFFNQFNLLVVCNGPDSFHWQSKVVQREANAGMAILLLYLSFGISIQTIVSWWDAWVFIAGSIPKFQMMNNISIQVSRS